MNKRRLTAVAKKEFLHVLRDPRSLMMGIGMPMLLLFLFGYALTLDVNRVPLAVWDQSGSVESRDFISHFSGSRYFDLRINTDNYRSIEQAIDKREAMIALIIPPDFSRRLSMGEAAVVQAIVDGSDPNSATIALGYAEAAASAFSRQVAVNQMLRAGQNLRMPTLELRPRVWFNTDMVSRNFIFPGLIAVVMMIMAAILTSLSMAREWETGTIEQLIATPLTGPELILGKLAPYFCIGILDLILCILVGEFIFNVPLRGSLWLLTTMSLLFLFGALSFGMLLSIITRNQPACHCHHRASGLSPLRLYFPAGKHAAADPDRKSHHHGPLFRLHPERDLSKGCGDWPALAGGSVFGRFRGDRNGGGDKEIQEKNHLATERSQRVLFFC